MLRNNESNTRGHHLNRLNTLAPNLILPRSIINLKFRPLSQSINSSSPSPTFSPTLMQAIKIQGFRLPSSRLCHLSSRGSANCQSYWLSLSTMLLTTKCKISSTISRRSNSYRQCQCLSNRLLLNSPSKGGSPSKMLPFYTTQ